MYGKRTIRILAVVTCLVTSAIAPSRTMAQSQPSDDALAAAQELFAVMSPDMLAQITNQMTAQFWPHIERELSRSISAETRAELRKEFERIQLENLTEVMKDGPAIYARHFTAAELRQIVAFYRSPVGQKALKTLPQVTGELMQSISPRMAVLLGKTQERFGQILRERGYNK